MQESNKLTKKEYWSSNWRKIKLPARYFYSNYSHILIAKLINKYIKSQYKNFLEIGGCPGRWSDFFYHKYNIICDSIDYDENNVKIIQENYKLLGIKGKSFLGDITDSNYDPQEKYDIVLSDGLIEHFEDSSEVFKNHLKYLNNNGLLIIGVPNIKKSWFYNYFAKKDKIGYAGYRHIDKSELIKYAKDNKLEVMFCDYVGVFNMGLVHSYALNKTFIKLFAVIDFLLNKLFKILQVKSESKTFSPYIFLIAKKNE